MDTLRDPYALPMPKRLWELDALRGLAVILMIAYHFIYDLDYYDVGAWDAYTLPALIVGRTSAVAFLLLVGISLTLSRARRGDREHARQSLVRGSYIFGLGMALTAVTWALVGDWFIIFGVLHLIGLSIILSGPLLERPLASAVLGATMVAAGVLLRAAMMGNYWTLVVGLPPEGYVTFDYFPILPWMGLVFIGMALGNVLYPGGKRRNATEGRARKNAHEGAGDYAPAKAFGWLGRHSLAIYLLHQPVIIGVLMVAGIV